MPSIDERVVSMAFENSAFEQKVNTTLASLSKLDSAVKNVGATNGLASVSAGADKASGGFSVLGGAASVALGTIATKAAFAGANLTKSLTLGPLSQGFQEYATNLNAIQTTLANTAADGTNLQQVNSALNDLNKYSDKTIYNFSQMAKNVGTFTAAGVKLKPATEAIKGIANLAALSGSSSEQASSAMYQLSQAIAAGKVNLQDWNSVVNSGMGGKVFQKALFDTGKAMHTITNSPVGQTFDQWTKAGNSFRQSLSATQKAAKQGGSELAKAQKDSTKQIADAHSQAADAISSAKDRVKSAQESAAQSTTDAAQRVKDAESSAADAVQGAADKVNEARKNVKEVAKKASEEIRAAVQAQHDIIKQGAADVASALDGVTEAQRRLADAMKPPSADELQAATDKLKTAQLDQADLASAITDAQTEQKRSAEDLAAAQKKLKDLQTSGGTADEIAAQTRAVEDAQKRATDAADAQERALLRQNAATRDLHQAETDLQDTQTKGTDQDKKVVDARDALTVATDKYRAAQTKARNDDIAAEKKVTDARLKGISDRKEAGKKLAEAEAEQAKTVAKSRQDVAKAEKDQAKTIIDARKSVADAEKDQAKTIKDSRESIASAEESAAERIQAARDKISGKSDGGPPSWLTSDVLTATLKQFTGDMTKAQLKAQGFTDAQATAILKVGENAKKSATEVKTIGQLFDVVKESIGSGWAQTFQIIFGDFGEAKKTFTALSNYITGFTNGLAKARNTVLKDWKALGGRAVLIEGIKSAFQALLALLKPIKDAFREIFPATTGKRLFELTKQFASLMDKLKIGPETADKLKRTFKGLFAVLDTAKTIVGKILGVFFDLVGVVGKGSGGFLSITASIGDFLVAIDNAVSKGGALNGVFDALSAVLKTPLQVIGDIAKAIGVLFGFGDSDAGSKIGKNFESMTKQFPLMKSVVDGATKFWHKFLIMLDRVKNFIKPFTDIIGKALGEARDKVKQTLDDLTSEKTLNIAQTGLLAAIFASIRKGLKSIDISVGGDVLTNLNKSFEALTGTLTAMQTQIHAAAIATIAVAIALLAGAIVLISSVDAEGLKQALTGIAVGLGELGAALLIMGKLATGSIKIVPLASSFVILAAAMILFGLAMKIMASMSWEEIAKGLVGIGGGLAAMGLGMSLISPFVTAMAPGILVVAFALNLLAAAVTTMAQLNWEQLAKGLLGVGGSLAAIGIGMAFIGPFIVTAAPGLVLVGLALIFIAQAVATLGRLKIEQLAKGIYSIGLALAAIGIGMSFMPLTLLPTAAGLVVVSLALNILAVAVGLFGKMKVSTLAKGIISMGLALVVLAVGLIAMEGTLPASAALLVAAGAFAILVPTLGLLGSLPWMVILKGLIGMAAVLGVLALAGALVSAPIALLGAALLPLGYAMLAIAGSILLFAAALRVLSVVGTKGLIVLGAAVVGTIALIPKLVKDFLLGLVSVLDSIVTILPKIIVALGIIIDQIIAFVIKSAPKLGLAIGALVDMILFVLVDAIPKIVEAGHQIMIGMLKGIDDHIVEIVSRVGDIIGKFLGQLSVEMPKIQAKGAELIVTMLKGIVANLPAVVLNAAKVVTTFLAEITRRMPDVVAKGIKLIVTFLNSIASKLPSVLAAGVNLIVKFINGIGNAGPRILSAGVRVIEKFMNAVASKFPELVDHGFKAIIKLLNGIEKAIRDNSKQLRDAGWGIADAIIDGMLDGFKELWHKVEDVANGLADKLPGPFKKVLGIHSPSQVFKQIGMQTMEGLAIGLTEGGAGVTRAVEDTGQDVVDAASDTFGKVPDTLAGVIDLNPVITPVLDLSEVKSGATELSDLTKTAPIVATVSAGAASHISAEEVSRRGEGPDSSTPIPAHISFTQNNTSPESLSDTEIYRQTKNQLSQVKRVLGLPGPQFAA